MQLYLRHDLFKNRVTIDGTDYDVREDPAEGYEPYEASDGRTLYRKEMGAGGDDESSSKDPSSKEDESGVQESAKDTEVDKDPLKTDSEESDSPADSKLGQDTKIDPNAEENAKRAQSAFIFNEDHHKDTDPLDHYTHAKKMEEMGDAKGAHFHREQAKQKIDAMSENDLSARRLMANKLRDAGFTAEADEHEKLHTQALKDKLDRVSYNLITSGDRKTIREDVAKLHLKRDGVQLEESDAAKQAEADWTNRENEASDALDEGLTSTQPATPKSKGTEDAEGEDIEVDVEEPQEAAEGDSGESAGEEDIEVDVEEPQEAEEEDSSAEDAQGDEQVDEQADEQGDEVPVDVEEPKSETDVRIEDAQKRAQEAATEDFKNKEDEYQKQIDEHEGKQKDYEKKLQAHKDEIESHKYELNRIKDRLKDVSNRKPVRDDAKERKLDKQLKDLQKQMDDHEKKAPKDPTEKHQKNIDKVKGEVDSLSKENESLKEELEKLKQDAPQPPQRPKNKDQLEGYEAKLQEHAKAEKEHKAKLNSINRKIKSKEKMISRREAKVKDLTAQMDVLKKDHEAALGEHKKKLSSLQDKHKKIKSKRDKEAKNADKAHEKQLKKWEKKKAGVEKELADAEKKKKELPKQKPSKPRKTPPPKKTHKEPETDSEELAHRNHTSSASKLAENIESHLKNNKDLTPEQKEELHDLHEKVLVAANQKHVPKPEDKAILREASKAAKEYGAHEHHDKKQARDDADAQKKKAQEDKVKAREEAKRQKEEARKQKQEERQKKQQEKEEAKKQAEQPRKPQGEAEEAAHQAYQNEAREKAEKLRDYITSDAGDKLSVEEIQHIQNAIEHYEDQSKSPEMPGKQQKETSKQYDQAMSAHSKAADKMMKDKEKADKAAEKKGAGKKGDSQKKESPFSARKTATRMLRTWSRGTGQGSRIGSAVARGYGGAGAVADSVTYAGEGVMRVGHALLTRGRGEPTDDGRRVNSPSYYNKRKR